MQIARRRTLNWGRLELIKAVQQASKITLLNLAIVCRGKGRRSHTQTRQRDSHTVGLSTLNLPLRICCLQSKYPFVVCSRPCTTSVERCYAFEYFICLWMGVWNEYEERLSFHSSPSQQSELNISMCAPIAAVSMFAPVIKNSIHHGRWMRCCKDNKFPFEHSFFWPWGRHHHCQFYDGGGVHLSYSIKGRLLNGTCTWRANA